MSSSPRITKRKPKVNSYFWRKLGFEITSSISSLIKLGCVGRKRKRPREEPWDPAMAAARVLTCPVSSMGPSKVRPSISAGASAGRACCPSPPTSPTPVPAAPPAPAAVPQAGGPEPRPCPQSAAPPHSTAHPFLGSESPKCDPRAHDYVAVWGTRTCSFPDFK